MSTSSFSQFGGAELLAKKYGFTKKDVDNFAVTSHKRAHEATKAGKFKNEIIPVPTKVLEKKDKKGDKAAAPAAPAGKAELHVQDEGIRPGTNFDGVSKMNPMF